MLSRLRLVAADLQRFARRPTLVVCVFGFLATVAAAVYLGDDATQQVFGSVLLGGGWLAIFVALAIEAGRHDRLRARLARQVRRQGSGSIGVAPPASTAPRATRRRSDADPLVTVVVTVHNEQDFVATCLRSLVAQTWPDWECVIVDDASTDSSLDVVADVTAGDPRFRVIHQVANRGLPASRNTGLAHARGRFVTFLDGDDFLYPDAINSRLEVALAAGEDAWVAGAYCGWHSVPEEAGLEWEPPIVPRRLRVSWFDSIFDVPFIASAPLVSTEAVKRIGGFDESLRTSEDFEFWSRFLRHGYVVDYADVTGVAYRQKRDSMYRATAWLHGDVSVGVYERNARPLPPEAVIRDTPFVFRDTPLSHQANLHTFRRRVTALTGVVALGSVPAIEEAVSEVGRIYEPWMRRVIDIPGVVSKTAERLESYDLSTRSVRAGELTRRTLEVLGPVIYSEERPAPGAPPALPQRGIELSARARIPWMPPASDEKPVLLLPSVAYHCDEFGPLADELASAGVPVAFGIIDRRWGSVRRELMKYPYPIYRIDGEELDLGEVVRSVSAVVTLNDWGDYKDVVVAANDVGVPTFGKVEGVQDFEDHDVYWKRYPYRAVAHVLAQGVNDVEAVPEKVSTIVGSSRLERIWLGPPTRARQPLAVINLNFTYGVLDTARDIWLSSSIAACRKAGVPYAISMHPAERAHVEDPHVSDRPIRHLLTQGTVLISRFSTVPFEAMARGVPFVYHNPHGETVPTFHQPGGAFPITSDVRGLVSALQWAADAIADYRTTARGFFERQVDVDPDVPSERRTAEIIGKHLSRI